MAKSKRVQIPTSSWQTAQVGLFLLGLGLGATLAQALSRYATGLMVVGFLIYGLASTGAKPMVSHRRTPKERWPRMGKLIKQNLYDK